MSIAVNTRCARRWFDEVWNARNEALIYELLAEHAFGETEAGQISGREAWIDSAYRALLRAFPDLRLELIGLVAQEDEVMVRWRAQGSHAGDNLGLAATGLRVDFRGMTWFRMRQGQIVEGVDSWNQSGLLQALASGKSVGSCTIQA